MGEIVNRTSEVAAQWQRHVVWIRMNVAYIQAELPALSGLGHDVSDIEALFASFVSVFEQFCWNELDVFVAARTSETGDADEPTLIAALRHMRESFVPWLREYHAVVEKTQAAGEPSLPLVLLHGCGAELFGAHNRFTEVIDAYVGELEE